jgi:hypothetical protein
MPITTRALLVFASLCGACATHISAVRPLAAEQAAELQEKLKDVRATVYLDSKQPPVELTRIKINPELLEGVGGTKPRSIPVASVRSITWRSGGAGFGRGAAAGVLLGPILGGVIGALIPPSNKDQDTIIHPLQGAFIGLYLGPLVFGVIGAIIGVENRIDF